MKIFELIFFFLDRMHDLSLRGSIEDSMDDHTASVVQHAVQVIDNHLSNIRSLLTRVPYSVKVAEGLFFILSRDFDI